MRVVYFGTPAFAVPSLRALVTEGIEVLAVVTQPDRPHGRSRSVLVPPPVKDAAIELGLPIQQPAPAQRPVRSAAEQPELLSARVVKTRRVAKAGRIARGESGTAARRRSCTADLITTTRIAWPSSISPLGARPACELLDPAEASPVRRQAFSHLGPEARRLLVCSTE